MVKNKRGWLRILEATIAILIMSSVLLVVYSKQSDVSSGKNKNIENLQEKILSDFLEDPTSRNLILSEDVENRLTAQIGSLVPDSIGYHLKVCPLTEHVTPCKMTDGDLVRETIDKDVYVAERLISSNITSYSPKIVRLFMWE